MSKRSSLLHLSRCLESVFCTVTGMFTFDNKKGIFIGCPLMWTLLFTKSSVVKPLCVSVSKSDKMVRWEMGDLNGLNPNGLFKIICQGIARVEDGIVAQLLQFIN